MFVQFLSLHAILGNLFEDFSWKENHNCQQPEVYFLSSVQFCASEFGIRNSEFVILESVTCFKQINRCAVRFKFVILFQIFLFLFLFLPFDKKTLSHWIKNSHFHFFPSFFLSFFLSHPTNFFPKFQNRWMVGKPHTIFSNRRGFLAWQSCT